MPPEACRFAPRCPYAGTDDCNKVQPELREIRAGTGYGRSIPPPSVPPSPWERDEHDRAADAGTGGNAQSGEPLLVVENLKKYFPIKKGILIDRTVDYVKAVDDVSFEI